jgi:DNA-binding NarL/FixJ family response regulator
LTPRERSVASAVLRGWSNVEVAKHLRMAPRTAANHLASIFRKLGIGSRAELAALFVKSVRRGREFEPRQG